MAQGRRVVFDDVPASPHRRGCRARTVRAGCRATIMGHGGHVARCPLPAGPPIRPSFAARLKLGTLAPNQASSRRSTIHDQASSRPGRRSCTAGRSLLAGALCRECPGRGRAQVSGDSWWPIVPGRECMAASSTATARSWKYLEKELGTKVTLRVANDYTAVIEGQKQPSASTLRFYGPAILCPGVRIVSGGNTVEPFANDPEPGRLDRLLFGRLCEAQTVHTRRLDDLKGKKLGPRRCRTRLQATRRRVFAHEQAQAQGAETSSFPAWPR